MSIIFQNSIVGLSDKNEPMKTESETNKNRCLEDEITFGDGDKGIGLPVCLKDQNSDLSQSYGLSLDRTEVDAKDTGRELFGQRTKQGCHESMWNKTTLNHRGKSKTIFENIIVGTENTNGAANEGLFIEAKSCDSKNLPAGQTKELECVKIWNKKSSDNVNEGKMIQYSNQSSKSKELKVKSNRKVCRKRIVVNPTNRHAGNVTGLSDRNSELKKSQISEDIDIEKVLGIRVSDSGVCNLLVQFKGGTSSWIEKNHLNFLNNAMDDFCFLSLENHTIIHRLPFLVYFDFKTAGKMFSQDDIDEICKASMEFIHVKDVKKKCFSFVWELKSNCLIVHDKYECAVSTEMYPESRKSNNIFGSNKLFLNESVLLEKDQAKLCYSNTTREFFPKFDELEVIDSGHSEIILRHIDKRSKRIKADTCDLLIQLLELKSIDNECPFIILSGLEDYFASSMDLKQILEMTRDSESSHYDRRVTSLRYLFQTIKNHPKPIIAMVNSAATGLAASILSLVDVVYDQGCCTSLDKEAFGRQIGLPVLFPKLMGMLQKNEALLMGELPNAFLDEKSKLVEGVYKHISFSKDLKATLNEMKAHKQLCDKKSFMQRRGQSSRSFRKNKLSEKFHDVEGRKMRKWNAVQDNLAKYNSAEIREELVCEIKKEREFATACLKDLKDFWNELRQEMA